MYVYIVTCKTAVHSVLLVTDQTWSLFVSLTPAVMCVLESVETLHCLLDMYGSVPRTTGRRLTARLLVDEYSGAKLSGASEVVPQTTRRGPVSYTHLDVYKRQH